MGAVPFKFVVFPCIGQHGNKMAVVEVAEWPTPIIEVTPPTYAESLNVDYLEFFQARFMKLLLEDQLLRR
jgi:hypothetical protein